VEVYNPRLDRWESEHLQDLVDCVPWQVTYQVAFQPAGETRLVNLKLGWFLVRMWAITSSLPSRRFGRDLCIGERRNALPAILPVIF